MKLFIGFLLLTLTAACTTTPILEERKKETLACIKDMQGRDDNIKDVFEVCRQIYGLKKVRENK